VLVENARRLGAVAIAPVAPCPSRPGSQCEQGVKEVIGSRADAARAAHRLLTRHRLGTQNAEQVKPTSSHTDAQKHLANFKMCDGLARRSTAVMCYRACVSCCVVSRSSRSRRRLINSRNLGNIRVRRVVPVLGERLASFHDHTNTVHPHRVIRLAVARDLQQPAPEPDRQRDDQRTRRSVLTHRIQ